MFQSKVMVSLAALSALLFSSAMRRAEPQSVTSNMTATRVAQAVEAAETSFTSALAAADIPKLEQLLTDDFTWTHTTGEMEMKKEYLRGVLDTRRYKALKRESTSLRIYEKAAVSSGIVHITVFTEDRGERVLHIRYTAVYVLQGGNWRLAAWHNTRLAE